MKRHPRDTTLKGEKHPSAKLTMAQVREIRARYAAGGILGKELAKLYGISTIRMSYLLNGKSYQENWST